MDFTSNRRQKVSQHAERAKHEHDAETQSYPDKEVHIQSFDRVTMMQGNNNSEGPRIGHPGMHLKCGKVPSCVRLPYDADACYSDRLKIMYMPARIGKAITDKPSSGFA